MRNIKLVAETFSDNNVTIVCDAHGKHLHEIAGADSHAYADIWVERTFGDDVLKSKQYNHSFQYFKLSDD